MQLSAPENLHQALATCTLLYGATQAQPTEEWRVDSSVLFYDEEDRVSFFEPTLHATRQLGDEESMTVRAVYDSLTGAPPNGAVTTTPPQTFTGAPGAASYTTVAGRLPTPNFSDARGAVGVDWYKRTSPVCAASSVPTSPRKKTISPSRQHQLRLESQPQAHLVDMRGRFALDRVQPHGRPPWSCSPSRWCHSGSLNRVRKRKSVKTTT